MSATPALSLLRPEVLASLSSLELWRARRWRASSRACIAARVRLQPGVRGVQGLLGRRRSALHRLECVRAHRPHLYKALPRRHQHALHDRDGCQCLDGLWHGAGDQAALCQVPCGCAGVHDAAAARSHGPDRLRFEIRSYRQPSSRTGTLNALLHELDKLEAGSATNLDESFRQLREHCQRRGLVAVISDLYCDPEALTRAVQPLAWGGHDIMIFQVLDRSELAPHWDESVLLKGRGSPATRSRSRRITCAAATASASMSTWRASRTWPRAIAPDHILVATDEPLDKALRQYLTFRQRS